MSQTPVSPVELRAAIAANIRAERARTGIDQAKVAAQMSDLGHLWTRQTVSQVERADRRVLAEELFALAMCLNTTIPRLLDGLT